MAEVDIERKQGSSSWWIWLIVALVVLALIWWLATRGTGPQVADGVTDGRQQVAATADEPFVPLTTLAAAPQQYFEQRVTTEGTVVEQIPDEGFWLEQDGTRVFVIRDEGLFTTTDVVAGQWVRVTGDVRDAQVARQEQAGWFTTISPQMQTALEGERVALEASDIHVDEARAGAMGTGTGVAPGTTGTGATAPGAAGRGTGVTGTGVGGTTTAPGAAGTGYGTTAPGTTTAPGATTAPGTTAAPGATTAPGAAGTGYGTTAPGAAGTGAGATGTGAGAR